MSGDIDTVDVRYTCRTCGVVDRVVQVPARTTQGILAWMRTMQLLVTADHSAVSPQCSADTLDELRIPMSQTRP